MLTPYVHMTPQATSQVHAPPRDSWQMACIRSLFCPKTSTIQWKANVPTDICIHWPAIVATTSNVQQL
jgi:hypothetical protein